MKSFTLIYIFIQLICFQAYSQQLAPHGPTPSQIKLMALHNSQQTLPTPRLGPVFRRSVRPFAEYEKTGYVVFNDEDYYVKDIKRQIAANLPDDVTLIIYTKNTDKNYSSQLLKDYRQYIPESRIKILQININVSSGISFWSRDSLPLPVLSNGELSLVDAKYFYPFEPDTAISQLFGAELDAVPYFFEGGNLVANSRGDCIVVNRKKYQSIGLSDTGAIPDEVFQTKYGCKSLTRLKHLKGIGHADEVVKFMSDDVVFTDTPEYKAILEKKGFTVQLLPDTHSNLTYVNSLIVNDTVFVPVYGFKNKANDDQAIETYESLGYKVVALNSFDIMVKARGSIHCFTMNYPPAPLKSLTNIFGGN